MEIETDFFFFFYMTPELVTHVSYAKRLAPDGSNEYTTFKDLCDGELSSTKLNKVIKLENK